MATLDEMVQKALQGLQVMRELAESLAAEDPRDRLSIKAADYAVELASGLVTLVQTNHSAAAAAISRPLLEATLTSLYFLYRAPLDKAVAVERGDGYIPTYKVMMAACQSLPHIGPQLKNVNIKPFHLLTHGDGLQLNRRGGGGPAFDANVQFTQVVLAHLLAAAAMQSAVVAAGKSHLQEVIHAVRSGIIADVGSEIPFPDAAPYWMPPPER